MAWSDQITPTELAWLDPTSQKLVEARELERFLKAVVHVRRFREGELISEMKLYVTNWNKLPVPGFEGSHMFWVDPHAGFVGAQLHLGWERHPRTKKLFVPAVVNFESHRSPWTLGICNGVETVLQHPDDGTETRLRVEYVN